MKSVKNNSSFSKLQQSELENINGGGWLSGAKFVLDTALGIFTPPFGCGLGDVSGRTGNKTTNSGVSSYPAKK